MKNILFLAADPTDASRLRLGEEAREIQEKLQLAKLRENFTLHQRFSVRPTDISQALLDVGPHIIHFSGHGTGSGAICVEGKDGKVHLLQPDALSALLEQFSSQVKCVVLNSCFSESQAQAIVQHIDYAIGMNKAVGDKAAIAFSIGFYQALGAGRSIEDAYRLGCVQVRMENLPEHLTPILMTRSRSPTAQPSIALESQKVVRIALWGPAASGKTTYLAALYGVSLEKDSRWGIRPSDIPSINFTLEQIETLLHGQFPAAQALEEQSTYRYEVRPKGEVYSSDRQFTVEFTDVAGEQYLVAPIQSPIWERLFASEAIVCMIDPFQANHLEVVFRFIQNLFMKQREKDVSQVFLPHCIAFCFSKMDIEEFSTYRDNPQAMVEFLAKGTGVDLNKLLSTYFFPDRLRFFCISSIEAFDKNRTVASKYSVLKPIEWILESLS